MPLPLRDTVVNGTAGLLALLRWLLLLADALALVLMLGGLGLVWYGSFLLGLLTLLWQRNVAH